MSQEENKKEILTDMNDLKRQQLTGGPGCGCNRESKGGSRGRLRRILCVVVMVLTTVGAVMAAEAEQKTPPAGPVAVVEKTEYAFSTVFEGIEVRHDFVIRNTGDAPLIIENVEAGCSCTTVSFTRSIPAGGEGTVTINFYTKGYGGKTISKTSKAYTNDPRNKVISFTINGTVEDFAEITPPRVTFRGPAGTVMNQQVLIIPKKENPFKIIGSKASDGLYIRFEVKETTDDSGRAGYIIDVENLKTDTGEYYDKIILKTDSQIQPELSLRVHGDMLEQKP